MRVPVALALRRGMICGGAIGTSMVAHAVVGAGLRPTLMMPLTWAMLTFVAMLIGGRGGWRPRGVVATGAILVVLQPAVHVAIGVAPWAFGMSFHHATPFLAPAMLLAHALAIVATALLIARVERLLDAALVGARAVLRALRTPQPRRRRARHSALLPRIVVLIPTARRVATVAPRGPPAAFPSM